MTNDLIIEQIKSLDNVIPKYLLDFDVKWDINNLRNFLRSEQNILIVARKGEDGCGLVRAHVLPRYDKKTSEILLHEIDVLPAHQRQGIALALINELKKIAKENKFSEIWVLTNESNGGALNLYQKSGFNRDNPDDVMLSLQL